MFFFIEPEVAGGLGDGTVMDTGSHPPIVSRLDYKFEGWLGDEILESFPCFIITKSLGQKHSSKILSGFRLAPVQISKSEVFFNIHGHQELPEFVWFQVTGDAGADDFGIAEDHRMVVSENALAVLRTAQMNHADFEHFSE
ncbi:MULTISPECIES: hypothetical protein [unclassified Pseudomonas]|uniref:hypothetical protein n=1 Tax=unclassified Pseudomonas TaxID=196821 RepID=UPI000D34337E|nr:MULTISPECIES: hypothetical protein [unclassified Pseudomonas]RAU45522.1 hypothetical protein DBP26_013940 [Pseudomonas sp. RIT 409]RAU53094.1 hypothetical protein DBY65_015805 [Pseudomonas sp. RIT 412]